MRLRSSPRSFSIASVAPVAWLAPALLAACITLPQTELRDPPTSQTDDDAGSPSIDLEAGATDVTYELPPADPHALLAVDPAHGPFSGGQMRTLRGNGFTSQVRVWFGAAELPASQVTPVDPQHVQIVVPPGAPGHVDVSAENGDDASTRRTLPGGYAYDAFYADPASGPTSGGTVVMLLGQGTSWNATSVVDVGGKPCASQSVRSATEIVCTVPKGAPGARSVTVTTGNAPLTVLDAFTYADSDNGFKGGLSGGPLGASLRVLVFDNWTGDPVKNATVIAGDDLVSGITAKTDAAGVALVSTGAPLGPRRTVTIAAKCKQPTTFVDVPVDTVTAYLDPILTPECVPGGDPSQVGGQGGQLAAITGELVWTGGVELKKAPWNNVPAPASPDEVQAAYVFATSGDPTQPFRLPDASAAVHPDSPGDVGYQFTTQQWPGNLALYAIAGIENRTAVPPRFTGWAMGVVQGISTLAGKVTGDVRIVMNVTLDQAITLDLAAPAPSSRGPDRVGTTVALAVGNDGWALLPGMQRTVLAPATAPVLLGGAPALTFGIASARYVATAKAGTGPSLGAPLSVLGQRTFIDASRPVALDAFVPVPTSVTPPPNGAWAGTELEAQLDATGPAPDLFVWNVRSGGGISSWTIASPAPHSRVSLPDLAAAGPELALFPGPVTVEVRAARIATFDYANLRYRDLASRGWNDWSFDAIDATYRP